jgi:hypothetical protein
LLAGLVLVATALFVLGVALERNAPGLRRESIGP